MEPEKDSNGINRELAIKVADQHWNEASERLKYATDYAQAGLKGLFLANGAAIVALLTFIGNAKEMRFDSLGIWWAFAWFSSGVAAVLATNILGYVSQASYMQASLRLSWQAESDAHETGQTFKPQKYEGLGSWAEGVGIFLAVASLMAFVAGAFVALDAIT